MRDQTAHFVQSDLDLHCPQKLLASSSVRKELKVARIMKFVLDWSENFVEKGVTDGNQYFLLFPH